MSTCSSCGKPPSGGILQTCTGCGDARYCNETCQRLHWKSHRAYCKAKKAMLETSDQASIGARAAVVALEPSFIACGAGAPTVLSRLAAVRTPGKKIADVISALTQAANPATESTVAAIVTGGGASLVVEIMANYARYARVAEWGCAALQTLAFVEAPIVDRVTDAGGAAAAVAALDSYGGANENVASAGCAALCHLFGGSARSLAAVVAAGGPRAVTEALRAHFATTTGISVVRNAVNFFHWVCRPDIAAHTAVVMACVEAGCVQVLLAVLHLRKKDPAVQSCVPTVLAYFAATTAANREAICAAGGAENI